MNQRLEKEINHWERILGDAEKAVEVAIARLAILYEERDNGISERRFTPTNGL